MSLLTALFWCQIIFALPAIGDVDYTMRIFNSDGTEPEMCGNGIRCLARFVAERDADAPRQYRVHTLAGALTNLLSDCLTQGNAACRDSLSPMCSMESRRVLEVNIAETL